MTSFTLILRSLRFYLRSNLGVLLGSAVGSAALLGALVVGDSVRESLRRQGLQRLGQVEWALDGQDRLFRTRLVQDWEALAAQNHPLLRNRPIAAVLRLPATAALADQSARANQVEVLGVDERFGKLTPTRLYDRIPKDGVVLNEALARQLRVEQGQTVLLRIGKPSALSREAIVTPQSDARVALRLRIHAIAPANLLGDFSLVRSQVPPLNAFVPLDALQAAVDATAQANLLLVGRRSIAGSDGPPSISPAPSTPPQNAPPNAGRADDDRPTADRFQSLLAQTWSLADAGLELVGVPGIPRLELRSRRIFLDPPVTAAVFATVSNTQPILTYLVNQLRAGTRATPYSMVTAMPAPGVPESMGPDDILINQWLADDLQVGTNDALSLVYYLADSGARLIERTNVFRIAGIVPMTLPFADRSLMPEFPGIAQAESTHDWDAGFPLVHKIREQDDQYWKDWRGTPKAFVTLAAGQRMWSNRFGNLTAIRFPLTDTTNRAVVHSRLEKTLLSELKPEAIGLRFEPVRAQAEAAATESQDFGGLFLGFSFFLVIAALILMGLLFQLGLETRLSEVGTLLALGFSARQVRHLILAEGAFLALVGGIAGVLGGMVYARTLLWGLTTLWRDAVGTSALEYFARPQTYLTGLCAAVLVSSATIALVLRKQVRRPARVLLSEEAALEEPVRRAGRARGWTFWVGIGAGVAAVVLVLGAAWGGELEPGAFFGAGSLLLIAGLAGASGLFSALSRWDSAQSLTVTALGVRSVTRQRKRSLASVALLACGTFLIIAVGANKLDADLHAEKRSSGTGGFALLGNATLPVLRDLNLPESQEFYGLNPRDLPGVALVSFRVRDGDEASCRNLNRAQKPRLLGVNPEPLDQRAAFTFSKTLPGGPSDHPWMWLRERSEADTDVVPAVGDENSMRWALGKKVGDTLDYTDEQGRPFKIRLVGTVANSILQGQLLIDEQAFLRRFPSESGYRMFLIDAPTASVPAVSAALSRALQDVGLELTSTVDRLAAFNAVQNTYLNTFQVLGGIGLLLGSAGLGVIVLRNVLERRGELALLQAVGFGRRTLHWLVLSEHGALLGIGLVIGAAAALLAVWPVMLRPGASWPLAPLALTLLGVLASGFLWTWLATRFALRGELLPALRNE